MSHGETPRPMKTSACPGLIPFTLVLFALIGSLLPTTLFAQAYPAPPALSGLPPLGGAVGPGGFGGRSGSVGGLSDYQQTEITRLQLALRDQETAVARARDALAAASFSLPVNPAAIQSALNTLGAAEQALALARAERFASLQNSPLQLTSAQVRNVIQFMTVNQPAVPPAELAPMVPEESARPGSGGVLAELNRFDGSIGTDLYTARNVTLLPDFKMELIYVVPQELGSWVPATFDDRGRMIVAAHNSNRIARITLPRLGTNDVVQVEPLNLDIGSAHGILYAFDALYVSVGDEERAGRKPSGLYRVWDSNGDDRYDSVEVLRNLAGGGQHGTHALQLSPDGGSIFMINGNATAATNFQGTRVPYVWGEDNLVERVGPDGGSAPQGWIARVDSTGTNWELYAMGMRNPVDFAFNKDGELFEYDADMEFDKGHPFYRPTNVAHVISGADLHFRTDSGTRKRPQYDIDAWQSVVYLGSGSPTGVTFGTGAKFPARYQDAMYLSDWSYGNIYAVHLQPDGSTYRGDAELFASGQPFGPGDIVVNPNDGAMYVIIGGNATSVIYRITYTGDAQTTPTAPDATYAADRALRRSLEAYHGKRDPAAVNAAWAYLGSTDRGIRYAARTAIEFQDQAGWRERALNETNPRIAMAAITALARVNGNDSFFRQEGDPAPDRALQARMLAALDRIDWYALDYSEQLDLLRTYQLAFIRLGAPDAATRSRLIAKFDPELPARYRELNWELAEMLIYLEAPSAATKAMALLRTAPSFPYLPKPSQYLNPLLLPRGTPGASVFGNENVQLAKQEDEVQYAHLLRHLQVGWTPELRREYFSWFQMANAEYTGGNTFKSTLATMRTQAIEALTPAARAEVQDILDEPFEVQGGRGGGGGGGGGRGGQ